MHYYAPPKMAEIQNPDVWCKRDCGATAMVTEGGDGPATEEDKLMVSYK